MQFEIRANDDPCQPPACYSNPRVVLDEYHGAPLLNWSGLILVRDLIKRLGVASAIERVRRHFRELRLRADSGYYSQALVRICEQREVEYFIVAKQHRNLMNAVRAIPEARWKLIY